MSTNEWISVKDRLPCEGGDYICARNRFSCSEVVAFCSGDEDLDNARWFDSESTSSFYAVTKERRDALKDYGKVTHWMPLPEPPKDQP